MQLRTPVSSAHIKGQRLVELQRKQQHQLSGSHSPHSFRAMRALQAATLDLIVDESHQGRQPLRRHRKCSSWYAEVCSGNFPSAPRMRCSTCTRLPSMVATRATKETAFSVPTSCAMPSSPLSATSAAPAPNHAQNVSDQHTWLHGTVCLVKSHIPGDINLLQDESVENFHDVDVFSIIL